MKAQKAGARKKAPAPKALPPKRVLIAKTPRKTCSVPLTNALKSRSGASGKMAIPVAGWVKEYFNPADYVTLPAPPCDDERRDRKSVV